MKKEMNFNMNGNLNIACGERNVSLKDENMATLIRFAHPPADVACAAAISGDAANAGFVTLCMDHEKGRCARDPCRCCHLATTGHCLLSHPIT